MKKSIPVWNGQIVCNIKTKHWPQISGPRSRFLALGLWFWIPGPGSWVLELESQVLRPGLQILWQKIITKRQWCDRCYKVWQEVIWKSDSYYKVWLSFVVGNICLFCKMLRITSISLLQSNLQNTHKQYKWSFKLL